MAEFLNLMKRIKLNRDFSMSNIKDRARRLAVPSVLFFGTCVVATMGYYALIREHTKNEDNTSYSTFEDVPNLNLGVNSSISHFPRNNFYVLKPQRVTHDAENGWFTIYGSLSESKKGIVAFIGRTKSGDISDIVRVINDEIRDGDDETIGITGSNFFDRAYTLNTLTVKGYDSFNFLEK